MGVFLILVNHGVLLVVSHKNDHLGMATGTLFLLTAYSSLTRNRPEYLYVQALLDRERFQSIMNHAQ